MTGDLILDVLIILALLALIAFFTASETSLTAASRARMHEQERRGETRAGLVQHLTAMRQSLISAILLGKNMVTIAASAIATSVLLNFFGGWGIVYAVIGMIILVLLVGEALPRTYAMAKADRVALIVAPLIKPWVKIFAPVILALEHTMNQAL